MEKKLYEKEKKKKTTIKKRFVRIKETLYS
jgi:hypothetical protein